MSKLKKGGKLYWFTLNVREISRIIATSGSYWSSEILGSRIYGNTFATLFTHNPTVWTAKRSAAGTSVLAVP